MQHKSSKVIMRACTLQHRSLITKGRATHFSACRLGGGGGGMEWGWPALFSTWYRNQAGTVFYTTAHRQSLAGSVRPDRKGEGATQGPWLGLAYTALSLQCKTNCLADQRHFCRQNPKDSREHGPFTYIGTIKGYSHSLTVTCQWAQWVCSRAENNAIYKSYE